MKIGDVVSDDEVEHVVFATVNYSHAIEDLKASNLIQMNDFESCYRPRSQALRKSCASIIPLVSNRQLIRLGLAVRRSKMPLSN